jgi:superfamily II DNA helicase RecQ/DNA polymerase III epsilon subunit-like protein
LLNQVEGFVAEHAGSTLDELIEAFAAASGRRVRPAQMLTELHRIGPRLIEREGRYWLADPGTAVATPVAPDIGIRARVIVYDLETVVRQISTPPYLERHLYQIGAVRTGRDKDWVNADGRSWVRWVTLPAVADPLLESATIRAKYEADRSDPAAVIDAFLAYCDGATHLVAYNGTSLDFGVLEALLVKHSRALPPGIRKVDGLYLAQALWPVPPNDHRLKRLLERLEIDVGEFFWHDARDDARMLTILLNAGQQLVASWPDGFRALIRSAGSGSDPWDLLFDLLPARPGRETFDDAEVRRIVAAEMTKTPVRDPSVLGLLRDEEPDDEERPGAAIRKVVAGPRQPLAVPASIVDASGHVDVFRLAQAAKPELAKPREAQERMVEKMRGWIVEGRPALVEAPTGTGKSYAMLAVALDWLVSDPAHRVVVSTFTKALQTQLADDIERIGRHIPGLLEMTDVVKGSLNRLSLRGLLIALADLCAAAPSERVRGRPDYTEDPRFRDLVLYVLLRFRAEGKRSEEWLAHSVDVVDVPPMFEDYIGDRKRNLYLNYLSQAAQGELGVRAGELALHTNTVSQALDENRLIIANHALLLAHLDVFDELANDTLLLVDEAHALEAAATQALSAQAATPEIWRLAHDIREWLREVPVADRTRDHNDAAANLAELDGFFRSEKLQRGGRSALDTITSDGLSAASYARRVVVASRLTGSLESFAMGALKDALRDVALYVQRIEASLSEIAEPRDPFERDRFLAMRSRARELTGALVLIGWDLYEFDHDQLAPAAAIESSEAGALESPPAEERPRPRRRPIVDDGPSNQLVWLEEIPSDRPLESISDLRFRVWSSPIELGRDPFYRAFRDRFPRTYYISATLRVGRDEETAFKFTRDRLALDPARVAAHSLPSPFDAAANAQLIAFDDFPSWIEQTEAATRTVAHQLAGYGRVMLHPDPDGEVAGLVNGAMVLTTSRAVAAEVGNHLVRERAETGHPLARAEILGTRRAIDQFAADGGILVGTKGLWQGVDIDKPKRLRLVWINKLPFPSFEDPLIKTRRALVALAAKGTTDDPDGVANQTYYLPLAAIELRQAVGRLLRTTSHQGVVVISDPKLAGPTRLRRLYREVFLGSLDPGLLVPDPETGEPSGGNIVSMAEGWRRIWQFFAGIGLLDADRAAQLCTDEALETQSLLPETLAIRRLRLTPKEESELAAQGGSALADEIVRRSAAIGGLINFSDEPIPLRDKQEEAIRAIAQGKDVLAVLPTGYGKSFVFQLPTLATTGVTVVVSPLVSLMTDQALELNRSIGGAVRALVAPMRESNSRTGKVQVQQQLEGKHDHGIRLIYMSPERLCTRQFQDWIRHGVASGSVRRIAIDEAHTFVTWGDDFRPSFRRAERFLRDLKAAYPHLQLLAFTATATHNVGNGLRRAVFGLPELRRGESARNDPGTFAYVAANPLRTNLALWTRQLGRAEGGDAGRANVILSVLSKLDRHAILYCLTVREAVATHNLIAQNLGEAGRHRVQLFHGRLPDTAKAAVLNAFKNAPRFDPKEPGEFEPLIVVATSAFGLGINREDVRVVFSLSPATDLAALYQQVGRAGRDHQPASGLMLATNRGFGTLRFMTRRDYSATRIALITGELLKPGRHWLSTAAIAREVAAAEFTDGHLDNTEKERLEEQIHILVVRILAELASAGALEDLGDFPQRVKLLAGTVTPDTTEYAAIAEAIWTSVDDPGAQSIPTLYERLAERFESELPDVGSLWSLLLTLHAEGIIEVSQMVDGRPADRGPVTGIRLTGAGVPVDLMSRITARQVALLDEVDSVGRFFAQTDRCVNQRFADYFDVPVLPELCEQSEVRCSYHWNTATGSADPEPELLGSFLRPAVAFTSNVEFRRRELRDLPGLIEDLLRYQRKGLAIKLIDAVLRGQSHYQAKDGVRRRLWPSLIENRFFNTMPTLKRNELHAAIELLSSEGRIISQGGFWRHPVVVAAEAADMARREQRRAAAVARDAARAARDEAAAGQVALGLQP